MCRRENLGPSTGVSMCVQFPWCKCWCAQEESFGQSFASGECYEPSTGQWRALPSMSTPRSFCAAVGTDGLFYVVGGYDMGRQHYTDSQLDCTDTAECYDPLMGQWRALPTMHESRSFCTAACADGLLYVLGGFHNNFNVTSNVWEDGPLDTMECYNPLTSLWQLLPKMSVARIACAAAYADGLIYVVGGCTKDETLASAECYDISTQAWQPLPDMTERREACAAVCLDGLLYVIGGGADAGYGWRGDGLHGGNALASVEVFNPLTREWQALPDMSVPRRGCAAACLDGLLYVTGGRSGSVELASAECYDPISRQWRSLPDMSIPRVSCAVAVLPTWASAPR